MADESFNWGNGQATGTAEPDFDPNTWMVPTAVATKSVEDIEDANSFRDIEERGDYDLIVVGFLKPELKQYKTHHQGREVAYNAHSLGVRLANAKDRTATTLDWFTLPPADARYHPYYFEGTNAKGNGMGFNANRLVHFLNRIGFNWAAGTPLPPEAARLASWKGRIVRATIDHDTQQEDKINPATGEPYPPRLRVVNFSYRAIDGPAQPNFPAMAGPQIPAPVLAPPANNISAPGQPPAPPAPAAARSVAPPQAAPPQPATNGEDRKKRSLAAL